MLDGNNERRNGKVVGSVPRTEADRAFRRRSCEYCGSVFYPSKQQIQKGHGRFCRIDCKTALAHREREAIKGRPKTCSVCGHTKPLSAFYCYKDTGLASSALCKACDCQRRRETAPKRGTPEYAALMAKGRERGRRWYEENKDRAKRRSQISYLKNRDAVLARTKKWQKDHPESQAARAAARRAKAKQADSHTPKDILDILKLQKGLCAACRRDIKKRYSVDHIVPLKRGGGNERSNIQLLCRSCNSRKNAKDPVDFMQEKGFLL